MTESSNATEDYVWALRDINYQIKRGEVLGHYRQERSRKISPYFEFALPGYEHQLPAVLKPEVVLLLALLSGCRELMGNSLVRENIFMNGAVLGISQAEIKAKLDEIIAFSGCEKYIDTPVKRYRRGMTVHLGFAVAAHAGT